MSDIEIDDRPNISNIGHRRLEAARVVCCSIDNRHDRAAASRDMRNAFE